MGLTVLVRDLMFASKLRAAAKDTNLKATFVRDPAKLADAPAGRLVVDLALDGATEAAAAWKARHGGAAHVVGFVGHVDAERLAQARALGFDEVVTNGRMFADPLRFLRVPEPGGGSV